MSLVFVCSVVCVLVGLVWCVMCCVLFYFGFVHVYCALVFVCDLVCVDVCVVLVCWFVLVLCVWFGVV